MFYSRSAGTLVERKAKKKTVTTDLITARGKPIWLRRGKVNKVRRIGALPWGQTKKLPWVEATAAELANLPSGQSGNPKGVRCLSVRPRNSGCRGGITRPSQRLADCRCGYTSFSATAADFLGVKMGTTPFGYPRKVGATTDPRHGCSVNTAEKVGRLVRFTKALPSSGVALTGGDVLPPTHATRKHA